MSLVSSDSEGEQNELRSLQEKLESAMRLVAGLSGQLSELKDQVRAGPPAMCARTPHALHTQPLSVTRRKSGLLTVSVPRREKGPVP